MTLDENAITAAIREAFPKIQAIYLFGSFVDNSAQKGSDLDLALLLPPSQARDEKSNLFMHPLQRRLQELVRRDVDLINLRRVQTVFQKEIIMGGRRIDCADPLGADEFDVQVLSRYQKLNEERAEIVRQFQETGRAYDV